MKASLYPAVDYDFPGEALEKHWSRLHRGDCEPYPAVSALTELIDACPDLQPPMLLGQVAHALQDAWRAFHQGEFREAERLGLSVAWLGFNVANKAKHPSDLH